MKKTIFAFIVIATILISIVSVGCKSDAGIVKESVKDSVMVDTSKVMTDSTVVDSTKKERIVK